MFLVSQSLLSTYPLNPLQILQRCNATNPLQRWRWRNVTQADSKGKATNGSVLYTVDPQGGQTWCLGEKTPLAPTSL